MLAENKVNILMVDDSPASLLAMDAVLSDERYNLVRATSGNEALRLLLKQNFALILMDVQMPTLNGFETARMIRQRAKNRHIPIIFVTGFGTSAQYVLEGYSAGAVDYMLKPVDPDILRAKVAFFIDLFVKDEALRNSGDQYRQMIESVRVIVWRAKAEDLRFTFITQEAVSLLGYKLQEWTSTPEFWQSRIHPLDLERVLTCCRQVTTEGASQEIEYRMIHAQGHACWFQNLIHPVQSQGKVTELIGLMVDIESRKRNEEITIRESEELERRVAERTAELKTATAAIQAALEEKETLLKEIHHRVKNNLQVICSLLSLQRNHIRNPEAVEVLNESQNRVQSMALIHEKLYETANLTAIDFSAYITELTTFLFHAYSVNSDRVRIQLNSSPLMLDIDTALPCGLILNELVSNALKYAFPQGRSGEIRVNSGRENDRYFLAVQDNGEGLPDNFDFPSAGTLGMKLVKILSDQLGATVELGRNGGTSFKIQFGRSNLKQRREAHV